jgi:hypothetical protein
LTYVEEQALKIAAVNYARAAARPLETRMRVDRARKVVALLGEGDPAVDRVVFQRDELDDARELAALTLLHAGLAEELRGKGAPPAERMGSAEELVELVRAEIEGMQRAYVPRENFETALLASYDRIRALVQREGCTRIPGAPPCSRDGACPVHGRDRPGQCVTVGVEATGSRLPATGEDTGIRTDSGSVEMTFVNESPAALDPLELPAATHVCRSCDKVFHQPFRCCGADADIIRSEGEDLAAAERHVPETGERS